MSCSSNRRRLLKGIDHISRVPDTILCLILSFLPTKSAVKTSILSRRWKYLWTKVPALDFTEMPGSENCGSLSVEQRVCFKNFVNRVLLFNDVSYIQRVCLVLSGEFDCVHVNSWLTAIAGREICELDVKLERHYFRGERTILPASFLSSERLTILKLEELSIVDSSMSFHLPHLETIHLINLKFPGDEFMKRLSSSCPVLKKLRIVRCSGITANLYVESLTLESLNITCVIAQCGYDKMRPCIAIKAPNLRSLALDDLESNYDISDLSLLFEAFLNVCYEGYYDDYASAYQLLSRVSGVKTLELGPDGFIEESEVPVFRNLTRLKLHLDPFTCRLLQCAPRLENLIIADFCVGQSASDLAPKLFRYLQSVEFCRFYGEEEDISTAEYFLKAAPGLKEMKISMDDVSTSEIAVCERLLMLPRSSATCQVKVVRRSC